MQSSGFLTFLALFLAYMAAQFPLQTSWILARKQQGAAAGYLAHGGVHALLAALCLALFSDAPLLSWTALLVLPGLVLFHLLVDLLRRRLPDGLWVFLGEQALHISGLAVAGALLTPPPYQELKALAAWFLTVREKILFAAAVYIAVIFAGGHLIRYCVRLRFKEGGPQKVAKNLAAGMYIGWAERFLVLTALLCRSPEAVGLMLTAKSIARFSELKDDDSAEYFLLGTLLSLSLALAGGLLLYRLLYGTLSLK
ncbi:MAG TPA: DUF3307 domain-containing protein [Thermoanaerobaculia bacterium]